jgi:hypothetical protein
MKEIKYKEFDFKSVRYNSTLTYAKATNKEYEQYYKERFDYDMELSDDDSLTYDGYIVFVGGIDTGNAPEWYSEKEFNNVFKIEVK